MQTRGRGRAAKILWTSFMDGSQAAKAFVVESEEIVNDVED